METEKAPSLTPQQHPSDRSPTRKEGTGQIYGAAIVRGPSPAPPSLESQMHGARHFRSRAEEKGWAGKLTPAARSLTPLVAGGEAKPITSMHASSSTGCL